MKHVRLFETKSDMQTAMSGSEYIEPWTSTYITPEPGETTPSASFNKVLTDFIYIELYQGSGGMFNQNMIGEGKIGPDFSYSQNSVVFVHDEEETEGVYHKCVYAYTSTTGKYCYVSTDNNWVVSAVSPEPIGESGSYMYGYNLNYTSDIVRPS